MAGLDTVIGVVIIPGRWPSDSLQAVVQYEDFLELLDS